MSERTSTSKSKERRFTMKETTRIITTQITEIIRHEEDICPLTKEEAAMQIKERLNVDDVVVESVQDFTREREPDGRLKELADKLNGIAYGESISSSIIAEAKEAGIVIVIGASDDLIEFSGAIEDEGGCCDGGTVYFDRDGISQDDTKRANEIEAVWCGKTADGQEASWVYETDIPHEKFYVYEDEEIYCEGIVFSVEDLK